MEIIEQLPFGDDKKPSMAGTLERACVLQFKVNQK